MVPTPDTPLTRALTRRPEVLVAYVFGSLAQIVRPRAAEVPRLPDRQRPPGPNSDIDVAVAAAAPMDASFRLALIDDIAMATGRPVDLIDLHAAGPLVLTRALTTGQCVLKRDPTLLARLIQKMWYLNADFMPLVRMIEDQRRRRFLHG